ncbi:MAG: DNA-processing protein DprA [Ignavibacteriales bacterium]|nr:DNA-processing protein DprA [Ignavibacteriales bacterium]MCF8306070.1 DNA-processing protein DprA [Ignavibacteriales bacterium]MCF8315875.1 DNA-processing protein DprA [Ignavibacteriales bacterium]MCF8437335.1 DNA-processing protein DprA [Ignavibacteriales bacterium]
MRHEDLLKIYSLLSIDGIGPGTIFLLSQHYNSPEDIFNATYPSLLKIKGISEILAKKIISSREINSEIRDNLDRELEQLQRLNGKLTTFWDEDYPSPLRNIFQPPVILYSIGNYTEEDHSSLAIVGTRNPSGYGTRIAEQFASEIAPQGVRIVSGLARGIDTIAHRSAINAGGRTIAVTGSGLDVCYPPENQKLYEQIAAEGVIFTEYRCGTKPDAINFPRRNRIISGLSMGVLLIETRVNGGAMHTAAFALDQGREIFAVPGNVTSGMSDGTNELIKRGEAQLVTKADEILTYLQLKTEASPRQTKTPPPEMSLFEQKIFDALGENPIHIDKIAADCGMNIQDCLINLLSLEFKGVVRQTPGKNFSLI